MSDEDQRQPTPAQVINGPWHVRCTARAKGTGEQCARWARPGASVCAMHGAGGKGEKDRSAAKAAKNRRQLITQRLEELAETAMETVQDILIDDVDAKPGDRLKAAEMVLERVVGKKLEVERPQEELDLDAEIESALGDLGIVLAPTGTDGTTEDDDDG